MMTLCPCPLIDEADKVSRKNLRTRGTEIALTQSICAINTSMLTSVQQHLWFNYFYLLCGARCTMQSTIRIYQQWPNAS